MIFPQDAVGRLKNNSYFIFILMLSIDVPILLKLQIHLLCYSDYLIHLVTGIRNVFHFAQGRKILLLIKFLYFLDVFLWIDGHVSKCVSS